MHPKLTSLSDAFTFSYNNKIALKMTEISRFMVQHSHMKCPFTPKYAYFWSIKLVSCKRDSTGASTGNRSKALIESRGAGLNEISKQLSHARKKPLLPLPLQLVKICLLFSSSSLYLMFFPLSHVLPSISCSSLYLMFFPLSHVLPSISCSSFYLMFFPLSHVLPSTSCSFLYLMFFP